MKTKQNVNERLIQATDRRAGKLKVDLFFC